MGLEKTIRNECAQLCIVPGLFHPHVQKTTYRLRQLCCILTCRRKTDTQLVIVEIQPERVKAGKNRRASLFYSNISDPGQAMSGGDTIRRHHREFSVRGEWQGNAGDVHSPVAPEDSQDGQP